MVRTWEGPLKAGVNWPRLLREMPQFFQSFHATVGELVQNAHRAGATRVEIRIDHDLRELTVSDNGRGSSDPEAFVTAGATGWDPEVAADPAGLGFFGLLGLSREVTVQSRVEGESGWQMSLTDAIFDGAEIAWMPIASHLGPSPHGVSVHARLAEKARLVPIGKEAKNGLWRPFQHCYPITLILTERQGGQEERCEWPPVTMKAPGIETPVGRLQLLPKGYQRTDDNGHQFHNFSVVAVWQHWVIEQPNLRSSLQAVLLSRPDGTRIWQCLMTRALVWVIDPASGVQPKLPDRRELIEDEAFGAALQVLADRLVAAFDAPRLRQELAEIELPRRVDELTYSDAIARNAGHARVQALTEAIVLHPLFQRSTALFLDLAGYRIVTHTDWVHWDFDNGEDGGLSLPTMSSWMRGMRECSDPQDAAIATAAGYPAVVKSGALPLEFRVEGVDWLELKQSVVIGCCQAITLWQGDECLGPMDELIGDEWCNGLQTDASLAGYQWAEDGSPQWLYLRVGSREALVQSLFDPESVFYGWYMSMLDRDGDIWEYVDEDRPDLVLIRETVLTEITQVWWPDLKDAQTRWVKFQGLRGRIGGLRDTARMIGSYERSALQKEYPDLPIWAEIGQLLDAIERLQPNFDRLKPPRPFPVAEEG